MTLHRLLALDVAPYPLDPIELGEDVAAAAPVWLWITGGACCVLTAAIGVGALVVLGWLVLRRRKG